jgi:hypothetical protein
MEKVVQYVARSINLLELLQEWKESVTVLVYMKHNKIVVTIRAYYCYQLHTKLLEIISIGFDIADQLLITYSTSNTLEKW